MSRYFTAKDLCNKSIISSQPILSPSSENLYNVKTVNSGNSSEPNTLNMKWETIQYADPTNPEVWGPAFWFTIHMSTINYPEKPTQIVQINMKNFILALPYLLPCETCQEHARNFIESKYDSINTICSSRHNLFYFFVDMHNYVNQRYGKPIMSYEYAWELYNRKINVNRLKFE